ncbi:MAG: winged helix-turn-helix domain-containing protein [Conexivisphaerales archaeon]
MQPQRTRSRIRIYYDILLSVMEEGNAKPTRVLYKANLSYDRLVKYLDELISKGLLQEVHASENRYYVITQQGVKFLEEVRKAEAFLSGFGLSL